MDRKKRAHQRRAKNHFGSGMERLESRALLAADLSCFAMSEGHMGAGMAPNSAPVPPSLESIRFLNTRPGDQNPIDRLDVSGDFKRTPLDAIQSINVYNACGSFAIPEPSTQNLPQLPHLDVDGDRTFSPSDIVEIINGLNHREILDQGILTDLSGTVTTADGATVTLKYSVERNEGLAEVDVTLEVDDAEPSTNYPLVVDGFKFGEITTDETGHGQAIWSNHNPEAQPLPQLLPRMLAGTEVRLGEGEALQLLIEDTPPDGQPEEEPREGDPAGLVVHAFLRGEQGEYGHAEFQIQNRSDGVELSVRVHVEHATPGTYDVTLNSTVLGSITIDEFGRGSLRLSTLPDGTELSLPPIGNLIGRGAIVKIGDSIQGALGTDFPVLPPVHPLPTLEFLGDFIGRDGKLGEIRLAVQADRQGFKAIVRVHIPSLPAGPASIVVSGQKIGEIVVDEQGNGELIVTDLAGINPSRLMAFGAMPIRIGELVGMLVRR